jgi:hypothetical protein
MYEHVQSNGKTKQNTSVQPRRSSNSPLVVCVAFGKPLSTAQLSTEEGGCSAASLCRVCCTVYVTRPEHPKTIVDVSSTKYALFLCITYLIFFCGVDNNIGVYLCCV